MEITLKELCDNYNLTEQQIKKNFKKVQQKLLKKYKVALSKSGRGKDTLYKITLNQSNEAKHAISMFDEIKKEIFMDQKEFRDLIEWEFIIFLAISFTPYRVYRGTYKEFLDYMKLKPTAANVRKLKPILEDMHMKNYIIYSLDQTDENTFVVGLTKKIMKDMTISSYMVRRCKQLAEENNKHSWIILLKTWIGMQMMENCGIFTIEQFSKMTGLSPYQIREAKNILEGEEIFITSKVYESFTNCLGQEVELNAFYND